MMRMDILQGLKGYSAHRSNGQEGGDISRRSKVLIASCDATFNFLRIGFSIYLGGKHTLDHSGCGRFARASGLLRNFAMRFKTRPVLRGLVRFGQCIFAEVLISTGVQDGIDSIKSLSIMCLWNLSDQKLAI